MRRVSFEMSLQLQPDIQQEDDSQSRHQQLLKRIKIWYFVDIHYFRLIKEGPQQSTCDLHARDCLSQHLSHYRKNTLPLMESFINRNPVLCGKFLRHMKHFAILPVLSFYGNALSMNPDEARRSISLLFWSASLQIK